MASRRGKLSLKRRKNTEFNDDGDVVLISNEAGRGASEEGRLTARENAAKWQSLLERVRWTLRQHHVREEHIQLPDLPAWYGLKEKEDDTPAEQEIIKFGNASFEWRPLPMHCYQCLVQNKHKRAVQLRGSAKPSIVNCDPKESDAVQSSAKGVGNVGEKSHFTDLRTESLSRALCLRNEKDNVSDELIEDFDFERVISQRSSRLTPSPQTVPISQVVEAKTNTQVQSDCTSVKNVDYDTRTTKDDQGPSSSMKQLPHMLTTEAGNDEKASNLSRKSDSVGISASAVKDSARKLDLRPLTTISLHDSLPSKYVEQKDAMPREAIEDFDFDQEILQREPNISAKSQSNNHSDSNTPLQVKTVAPKVASETVRTSSKEKVKFKLKHTVDQPLSISSKNLSNISATKSNSRKETSVSSKSELSRNYSLGANSDLSKRQSAPSIDFPKERSASASLMTNPAPVTSKPKYQKEDTASNSTLQEVIVLDDSDEEETLQTQPNLSLSSSVAPKRKFSSTSGHAEERDAKRPRRIELTATSSGNLATKLQPVPKPSTDTEHKKGQLGLNQLFGPKKSAHQNLVSALARKTISDVSHAQVQAANFQMASRTTAIMANTDISSESKQSTSNTGVSKHGLSTEAKHASVTSTPWKLSSNAKPLFKKQRIEKPTVEARKLADQVHHKAETNPRSRSFSTSQTQSHKVLTGGMGLSCKTRPSTCGSSSVNREATTTLAKPQHEKISDFPGPSPVSGHLKTQATFRPNRVSIEQEKQPKKSLLASANQQSSNTNPHVYSGFQTARDIRTNQVTHPKQDIKTVGGISHPKQDILNTGISTELRAARIGTNQDNKVNQHTSWGNKEGDVVQCCPLCELRFLKSWTPLQRDEHIALCLSQSTSDVW